MDVEFVGGLLLRFARADQRDGSGTELRWVSTRHGVQPSGEGSHLATGTGTFLVGQVKMTPIRAADPLGSLLIICPVFTGLFGSELDCDECNAGSNPNFEPDNQTDRIPDRKSVV